MQVAQPLRARRELAASMALRTITPLLAVVPFLAMLVWFGITESAQCGGYCALTFVTMYALMRYRRSEYSMQM